MSETGDQTNMVMITLCGSTTDDPPPPSFKSGPAIADALSTQHEGQHVAEYLGVFDSDEWDVQVMVFYVETRNTRGRHVGQAKSAVLMQDALESVKQLGLEPWCFVMDTVMRRMFQRRAHERRQRGVGSDE